MAAGAPTAPAPVAASKRTGGLTERARAERKLGWMLCAPAVVAMLVVTGYPIGYAVFLSLQRYDLRGQAFFYFAPGLGRFCETFGSFGFIR